MPWRAQQKTKDHHEVHEEHEEKNVGFSM